MSSYSQCFNINTIAGNGIPGYSGDGSSANLAQLNSPQGIAVDDSGNVYIADENNNRIRKINTGGIISTIAGNGKQGFSGDGGNALSAKLYNPSAVAVDDSGNVYIVDTFNSRIRKVNKMGIITTFAGGGTGTGTTYGGYRGDGGPAIKAQLAYPSGVTVDDSGNVYIADTDDDCIRKVNRLGIISTVAGNINYGFSGDGGSATAATLLDPMGVILDKSGNMYIADHNNQRVRKVNTNNIISTFAGKGQSPDIGDGGQAIYAGLDPFAVEVDSVGNVYIADKYNNRIRKVNTNGIISTYVGNGYVDVNTGGGNYSGDGGVGDSAELYYPAGIAIDKFGNLFIAEEGNNRIRKVSHIQLQPPTVTTDSIKLITSTSAIVYGNVIFNGGDTIVRGGVCYNTSTNPTINDNNINSGHYNVGYFGVNLSNLIPKTKYYVRSYTTNRFGTYYGSEMEFTTLDCYASYTLIVSPCNSYTSPSGKYTWTTSGIHYDTIVNSAGCDSLIIVNLTVTGINEVINIKNVSIYPNPFTSQTTISFSQQQTNTTIKIVDVLGKEIKTINFTGIQCLIAKEEMDSGVYFVQIRDGNNNLVNRKIIVQ
jgi:streptogramin lyase